MQLLFTTTGSWISRLIRKLTSSSVSHSALGLEWGGVPVILEADWNGVVLKVRSVWETQVKVIAEYEVLPRLELNRALSHIGARYDYRGLLGFLWVLVAKRLGKRLNNKLASSKAMICSEFIVRLGQGVIEGWGQFDPETTSPADLHSWCETASSLLVSPVRKV